MLFPFRTDAPIYHLPVVTVGLIVVNTLLFITLGNHPDDVSQYWLSFGDGLHPSEWLTSVFFHFGIMHLIGNMLWLWSFGLIVEGKLGWWKFLLVFLAIGIGESAISQTLMLAASESYAAGASSAIFGLLCISLIWAPKNEITILFIIGIWPRVFDVTIAVFAGCYILFQFVMALITQFSMGSALSHLIGGGLGLVVGLVLLTTKRVDCEGWDLFSVWLGRHMKMPSEIGGWREAGKKLEEAVDEATDEGPQSISHEAALAQINEILATGKPQLALVAHKRLLQMEPEWLLPPETHLKLISLLLKEGEYDSAVETMRHYLELHKQKSGTVRLKLAEVLIAKQERPAAALKVLAKISPVELNPQQEEIAKRLRAKAEVLQAEGAIELESDDF